MLPGDGVIHIWKDFFLHVRRVTVFLTVRSATTKRYLILTSRMASSTKTVAEVSGVWEWALG